MTKPAALQAVFVDYRRVKTRKVMQIIFEVPSEKWPEYYSVLGEPMIDGSEWFAIARMQGVEPQEAKGGRLAQRAGILCSEGGFRRFLADRAGNLHTFTEEQATQQVYRICNVSSRRFLDHDETAGRAFHELEIEYKNWRDGLAA
jgi:hypothetical protein